MALVTTSGYRMNLGIRAGQADANQLWKPFRRKVGQDVYSVEGRKYTPPNLDPFQFPRGGLQGLDGTGIEFVDTNLAAIKKSVDDAVFATKLTMYFSIAAGLGTILLFFRTAR